MDCDDASSTPDPKSTASLVRAIHAAGAVNGAWSTVLDLLSRHLDARVVTLGFHEFGTGREQALCEAPADAGFAHQMEPFAARNPWFLSTADYAPGRVITGEELIGTRDLRRTDFYRGFLQPRGLLHRLCGVVSQRGDGAHLLSAYRGEDQSPFGPSEKAELDALLDHVTLALEGQWRWQQADDLVRAMFALLREEPQAVMLVTGESELVHSNPAADLLLDQEAGLRRDGGRLVASTFADQRVLRESIARLAQVEPAQPGASPAVLTLACDPPPPPVVILRPAGQVFMRDAGSRRGLVVVKVRTGHGWHDPASCAFARQFALTAAQAKVSAFVFAGQPLAAIARSLHVSENTVRSHLKQVFQKTGTHGQMDLVHLHARVCTTLA